MDADPRPEAVGRPAALRRLLAEIEEDHGDEIAAWSIAAPEPAERASFNQVGDDGKARSVRNTNTSPASNSSASHGAQWRGSGTRRGGGTNGELMHDARERE